MRARIVALALFASACSARTEIVLGLVSDLRVPSPLRLVTLVSLREGVPVDRQTWPQAGAELDLPGSYGLYSGDGSAPPLSIQLSGFRQGGGNFTRTADVTPVAGRTLFLRLSLVAACETTTCLGGTTCIEGTCATTVIDGATLPAYRADLVRILQCASGPIYIDSVTGSALPVAGVCDSGQTCREGICYPAR